MSFGCHHDYSLYHPAVGIIIHLCRHCKAGIKADIVVGINIKQVELTVAEPEVKPGIIKATKSLPGSQNLFHKPLVQMLIQGSGDKSLNLLIML